MLGLLVVSATALAPAASLADNPGLSASAPPYDYPGFQSHLILDDVGNAGGLPPNQVPSSLSLLFAQGFGWDPQAVSTTCTTAEANNNSCPTASRIGRGTIDVTLSGLLNGTDAAQISLYAMAPQGTGDIAGVAFYFYINDTKNQFQFQGTSIGHLKPVSDPTFGTTMQWDKLPVPQVPPGINVTLNDFKVDIGAPDLTAAQFATTASPGTTTPTHKHKHKHKKKKKKHHAKKKHHVTRRRARAAVSTLNPKPLAHSLLTNPPSCSGSWPVRVVWGFSGGPRTADAAAPCSAAP